VATQDALNHKSIYEHTTESFNAKTMFTVRTEIWRKAKLLCVLLSIHGANRTFCMMKCAFLFSSLNHKCHMTLHPPSYTEKSKH